MQNLLAFGAPLPKLLFFHGKGGVGRTLVSKALALSLSQGQGKKVLWVEFENAQGPQDGCIQAGSYHDKLNVCFLPAFAQYVGLKLGLNALTQRFLKHKMIQVLADVAPGLKPLVLIGKAWFERSKYQHVLIDLPSTGFGLTFFQSTQNFERILPGSPLQKDAASMLESFRVESRHLILTLAEETPLQESLELSEALEFRFPENPPFWIVNRCFPKLGPKSEATCLSPGSLLEYAYFRSQEEALKLNRIQDRQALSLPWLAGTQETELIEQMQSVLNTQLGALP